MHTEDIRIHKIKMYKKYRKVKYIFFNFCNLYIYNTDIVKMQYDAMWQVIVSERIKEREYSNK